MRHICLTLALALAWATGGLSAAGEERFVDTNPKLETFVGARVVSVFMETNYVTELHWSEVRKSPAWTGEDKPPLTPQKAEALAKDYFVKLIPQHSHFLTGTAPCRVYGISLRRWFRYNLWYYEVSMVPYLGELGGSYNHPGVTVFVTMDGHVCQLRLAPTGAEQPVRK